PHAPAAAAASGGRTPAPVPGLCPAPGLTLSGQNRRPIDNSGRGFASWAMPSFADLSYLAAWRGVLRRSAEGLFDAVLPPRCLQCGDLVGGHGALCGACWSKLRFLGAPCCAACGLPFEFDLGGEALCGACSARRLRFERARA